MLTKLTTAPEIGKNSEITKHSGRLDAATGDTGDVRLYTSKDGKTTYLRVWSHTDASDATGSAEWYEVKRAEAISPASKK